MSPIWSSVLLVAGIIVTRIPYVTDFESMGKDGPEYINSLSLDANYNVPAPGNIGFVVLARAAQFIWPTPVYAYQAVTISITCAALVFVYLLGTLVLPRSLAAAAAIAFSCDTLVWWHAIPIKSYPVWMAALPAIAYFGGRFIREHRMRDALAAGIVLGVGSIVRNDLIVFGSLLWFGCLLLGRARLVTWLASAGVVAVCVAAWVLFTSYLLGGFDVLVYLIRHKSEVVYEAGSARGLVEGFFRNAAKYGVLVLWSCHLALIPGAYCLWRYLRSIRTTWRALVLALLWMIPCWYFAFFVVTFTSAQIVQFSPLIYLGAVKGIYLWSEKSMRFTAVATLIIAAVCAAQFTLTPLLPLTNQRNVIINVMFIKYTGAGIRNDFNYNQVDFGMDSSLRTSVRQLWNPEPVPKIPPPRLQGPNEPLPKPDDQPQE